MPTDATLSTERLRRANSANLHIRFFARLRAQLAARSNLAYRGHSSLLALILLTQCRRRALGPTARPARLQTRARAS
eukprot:scaffold32277_cov108-Isochrysis_galbana.AAC.6